MKKSDNFDFSIPTRQSLVAIILITYRLYKVIVRQAFPLIIVVFIGGNVSEKIGYLLPSIIVLATVLAIYGIVAFFKYYFFLEENKLIVQSGVFKKTKTEIPFDRIQSINFEQNLIHRLFGVVKLNMDTAGSAGDEFQLNALSREKATALREYILNQRTEPIEHIEGNVEVGESRLEKEEIFRLSIWQLLKVGITANHLASAGLIFIFFIYAFDSLEEVGLDIADRLETYVPMAKELIQSIFFVVFLVLLVMIVALIISMVRVILRFYDLRMYRVGDGFMIESGLLARRQFAAKDRKVQILSWSQNWLQKISNLYTLELRQASAVERDVRKSIPIVGLSSKEIDNSIQYLFRNQKEEIDSIHWEHVDQYYLLRRIVRWVVLASIFIGPLLYFKQLIYLIPVFVVLVCGLLSSVLSYKKKLYGITNNTLAIRGGVFGDKISLMENYKTQNVKLTQTPFQRRRKLSSVIVYTASRQLFIPDIKTDIALRLKDYLLYKIESEEQDWM